ncbi:MAG: histidine ammonia-lyase [Planctomycetota bacterium]
MVFTMTTDAIRLTGAPLTVREIVAVARHGARVELDPTAAARIAAARAPIERIAVSEDAVYGINTGFGSLSRVRIEPERVADLQRNLIRSHAAGVGEPLPSNVVRAMILLLAASLSRGHSGVRVTVVERLLDMLNHGIMPVIPSRGSVGASGDLAPLSHAILALIGEGEVFTSAGGSTAAEQWKAIGIDPVELNAKEGLALINGTHLMAAMGALMIKDVDNLVNAAIGASAMAIDACRGTDSFLDPRVHAARCQPGQRAVAATLRELIEGSAILPDHATDDPRVQDPYCLRAMPQVIGAAVDALRTVRQVFMNEFGAVTDNPLVFAEGDHCDIISAGNFHGMPLSIAFDHASIALCHIAGIAERRMYWLLKASDSENPVNAYLSPQPGLHSGLMIVQYTAAACCNEMQTLATPASVANIPTSAGIEDYNSMGVTAGHQVMTSIQRCREVIAMEFLVMTEALEYQRPLRSGAGVEALYDIVRSRVPRLTEDRPPSPDIEAIAELIQHGDLSGSPDRASIFARTTD